MYIYVSSQIGESFPDGLLKNATYLAVSKQIQIKQIWSPMQAADSHPIIPPQSHSFLSAQTAASSLSSWKVCVRKSKLKRLGTKHEAHFRN